MIITTNQISKLSKLYVWSICLESLLFFIIADSFLLGTTANVSKILQLLVLVVVFFKILILNVVKIPSPLNNENKWFFYFFIFVILSGLFGLLSGAYKNEMYDATATQALRITFRPLFEYVILLYYFVYFAIMPKYFLSNSSSIGYFFKVFTSLFFIVLFVGFGDLLIMKIISGYEGLPRHLADGRDVGWRFHGLAGEPRDAFAYLVLGLSIFILRDMWSDRKKLTKYLMILIFIALILTQSASGLIGILFSILLMFPFLFLKLTNIQKVKYLTIISIVIFIVLISVFFSYRILIYYDAFFELIPSLKETGQIKGILSQALSSDVYPIWQRWIELSGGNFFPTFFGTGLGSASVINNNLLNIFEIHNPKSYVARSIYETGIIGTYLFVYAFLSPIKKINLFRHEYIKLTMLMLLMLGMYFAHRSVLPFLFLGIVMAVFNSKLSRKNQ
jgi:hypothetical protein